MDNELWMPVPEYDGLYEVSNLGRVRSLPRMATPGKIRRTVVNKDTGYVMVALSKNSRVKNYAVHRLVYAAFHNLPLRGDVKLSVIDHIDGDRTNNRLENLDCCTQSENMTRAYKRGSGHQVIDLRTKRIYHTAREAAKDLGVKDWSISAVCNGHAKTIRGKRFARLSDYLNDTIPEYAPYKKVGTRWVIQSGKD